MRSHKIRDSGGKNGARAERARSNCAGAEVFCSTAHVESKGGIFGMAIE